MLIQNRSILNNCLSQKKSISNSISSKKSVSFSRSAKFLYFKNVQYKKPRKAFRSFVCSRITHKHTVIIHATLLFVYVKILLFASRRSRCVRCCHYSFIVPLKIAVLYMLLVLYCSYFAVSPFCLRMNIHEYTLFMCVYLCFNLVYLLCGFPLFNYYYLAV